MIIKNRITIDRENECNSLYTNKYHADPSQCVFPEFVDDFRFVVCREHSAIAVGGRDSANVAFRIFFVYNAAG